MDGFWIGIALAAFIATLIPHPSANRSELDWGEKVCAQNGGIESLRPSGMLVLPTKVVCKNTAIFVLSSMERPQKIERE